MQALEFAVNCPTGEDDSYQGRSGRVSSSAPPVREESLERSCFARGPGALGGFTPVMEGGF